MHGEHSLLLVTRRVMNPVVVVFALLLTMAIQGEVVDGYYLVLAIIVFFLSSYLFDDLSIVQHTCHQKPASGVADVLFAWLMTVGVIVFLGHATKLGSHFDHDTLLAWFVATPALLLGTHLALRMYMRGLRQRGHIRRAIVIGANEAGEHLAKRLRDNECLFTEFQGFIDDRQKERLAPSLQQQYLGSTRNLLEVVRAQRVDVVYLSLPISQKERINSLLNMLKDSTASVYIVPDIFTYDLIQARIAQMGGVPVIAMLETPFLSINALNKRIADIFISSLILLLMSPFLAAIAVLVKLSSPGPVLFKQRRYGLNGEEIIVYKFRSMRVCEDGDVIRQATLNDDRVTPIGRILRKTSMDEMPQFINVLQGHMSIVGPRPHAVAHNEQYRKLISGYMLRHKAKPGITGWAQVNGLRGETDTVEKMAARIEMDLDYLRNWSLSLDLMIILKTAWLVFKDAKAY